MADLYRGKVHGHLVKRSHTGKHGSHDHHDYPTHHVKEHGKHPHLHGSGSKGAGAYGKIKDTTVKERVPARGMEGRKYLIEDGSRAHKMLNHNPDHHHSKPGHTEQYPFRKHYDGLNHDVPHAFRAHHQPESSTSKHTRLAHGPMAHMHGAKEKRPDTKGHSSYSPLRFSGHPHAHQIGKLSHGRKHFEDRQTHVWGKTSATKQTVPHKGEKTVARGLGDKNRKAKYSLYT